MKIAFRVDASLDMGTGHVMRCLTLAEALRDRGVTSHFVCRAHPGNLIAKVRSRGFEVSALAREPDDVRNPVAKPAHAAWLGADWRVDAAATREILQSFDPDWLVVDHYALDQSWERDVRADCGHLMVIDDLADRAHECDLLLDQTATHGVADYADLMPEGCMVLAGPRFALVRPEFAARRRETVPRQAPSEYTNLLVMMGGIDRVDATGKVLTALRNCELAPDTHIVVVMGGQAPWLGDIETLAKALPWVCEVKVDVEDVARLLVDCDLAIGAAGGSAWERCVLGVPSIVVVTAQNQEVVARSLERYGAARVINDVLLIERELPLLLGTLDRGALEAMSRSAASMCDGRGVHRVIDAIVKYGVTVRSMAERDLDAVLRWRNDPDVRRWMYSSHAISPLEHREWYARAQGDPRRHLLIVEKSGIPVGFVQFTEGSDAGAAEWGFYAVPGAPRGTGHIIGAAALDYAFREIGLRKICGEAAAFNERSLAFHRRLGFREEGAQSEKKFEDGTHHAVVRFSLEASDWIG